ncbi:MAG TPA: siphovirus Gp157 family protein [Terriglobales bacterium]|nr:siphovirus Gp157 family protein [Terriglobales bacterium]
MQTNVVPAPKTALTLYELEDNLAALANTFELVEEAEAKQLILEEIGRALRQVKEKRDALVGFLRHCAAQQEFADQEIERIRCRRDRIAKFQTELEQYVVRVIDQFAVPDRRGVKRMEGNISSLRIQKNPDSVVITDENALPLRLKDAVLTLPAHVWEALLQRLDKDERGVFEAQVKKREFKPDKRALADELKNGEEIPGADLRFGELRLVLG